jgi:uncharacterized protein (DUF169 family)
MKKLTLSLFAALSTLAFADGGKEVTIEGQGACPKCCLKTAETCGLVVTVEKDGKKTAYQIADGDITKEFHATICKAPKAVKVTGVCKKVGDHLEITPSKIEEAK